MRNPGALAIDVHAAVERPKFKSVKQHPRNIWSEGRGGGGRRKREGVRRVEGGGGGGGKEG